MMTLGPFSPLQLHGAACLDFGVCPTWACSQVADDIRTVEGARRNEASLLILWDGPSRDNGWWLLIFEERLVALIVDPVGFDTSHNTMRIRIGGKANCTENGNMFRKEHVGSRRIG